MKNPRLFWKMQDLNQKKKMQFHLILEILEDYVTSHQL